MTKIEIVLNRPAPLYYTGIRCTANVAGKVLLSLNKPKKIKGIRFKVKGSAESDELANETYFCSKSYLVGSSLGEIDLPAGEYKYPFNIKLPSHLPSTFWCKYGQVTYTMTATLFLLRQDEVRVSKDFRIFKLIDLNDRPLLKEPVCKEAKKTFWCCLCQSGSLSMVVRLPQSGYLPGQTIRVMVEVDNPSNIDVNRIVVKLEQVLKWREVKITKRKAIAEMVIDSSLVRRRQSNKAFTQYLTIPFSTTHSFIDDGYTANDQCSVVKSCHLLKVVAEVSGMHRNLCVAVPIVLGHVDFRSSEKSEPRFVDVISGCEHFPNLRSLLRLHHAAVTSQVL